MNDTVDAGLNLQGADAVAVAVGDGDVLVGGTALNEPDRGVGVANRCLHSRLVEPAGEVANRATRPPFVEACKKLRCRDGGHDGHDAGCEQELGERESPG